MWAKRFVALLSPLLVASALYAFHPAAVGQGNPQCPTRPSTDSSNACASTAFVQNISGSIISELSGQNATNISAGLGIVINNVGNLSQIAITGIKTQLGPQTNFYVNGNSATTTATTAAGNSTLHFAAGSGTTNNTTAAGSNILHFSSTPLTIYVGATITDSTASVIPANTTVTAITQTTVTLSANITGGGVGNGDTIKWSLATFFIGQQITDSTAAVIPASTTISSIAFSTTTDVTISANVTGGGVGNGDTILWTAICGRTGNLTCGIGSDSVTALSAQNQATPFLTLNAALQSVIKTYDFFGSPQVINLAHGANTNYGGAFCAGPMTGWGAIWIFGDNISPTAATMVAPNGNYGLWVSHYCIVRAADFMAGDQGTATTGFYADEWGGIDFQSGVVTLGMFNTGAYQLTATGFGHFELGTNNALSIVGGAGGFMSLTTMARFVPVTTGGAIPASPLAISIPSAVNYTISTISAQGPFSMYGLNSGSFNGAGFAGTTGLKANINGPGYLNGNGATCNTIFPGNSNCQMFNGFQDDANDVSTYPGINISLSGALSPDALLTINANTAATIPPIGGTLEHIVGPNNNNATLSFDSYGVNTSTFFARAARGTLTVPTALSSNATAFSVGAQGYDGVSAYGTVANFQIESINQTSTTDHSGAVRFRTVATGSVGAPVNRMVIQQGITLGSGSLDPGPGNLSALTINVNNISVMAIGGLNFAGSTTGASTQTFTNSPCTGLTSEKWIAVQIVGQTGNWFIPACQ